ncbi:penicillin-binding protein 1A [Methylomonas sp. SURF-2]|uniref:Penicillin-binding protein 1A n=1 Tax=Methylomonas subterranea TaxID=2952225 RepID=A0ABT1TF98_9GAMM|nr:penicillin-binding protein 1A [Methylomonas sp. SURF-2]MCQ8104143.1 penicillin-binding protein 1A [Methylomonas sp. SURF-2]
MAFLSFFVCFLVACYFFIVELSKELPDIGTLENVQYQTPLSIYTQDNLLIGQFGEKRRIPVTIQEIPRLQIQAFLAAEDERFYSHPGVDVKGLLRAANQLLTTGKKTQGGSTITMQVARNFLLGKEKTYLRKLKEILLAIQIEQRYSKDQILELYLNKIYMGQRAYGLAAAAQAYYGRNLDELKLYQQAMIAGLPKAPSIYNPIVNAERALERRNYVLRRMLTLNVIQPAEYRQAIDTPDDSAIQPSPIQFSAPFIAEMARQELVDQYGEDAYTLGLKVYTTVPSRLQQASDKAVQGALHQYDERYGYRGLPHAKLAPGRSLLTLKSLGACRQAVVTSVSTAGIGVMVADGATILIAWENVPWKVLKNRSNGTQSIRPNDLVWIRQLSDQDWAISQIPAAEGAFAAINPNTGAILALSGSYDFYLSRFNRATQSKRQPGSGFKPFIYAAALEKGFTVASIINDAPIVVADPSLANDWRPENYTRKFLGPIPLRTALRQSINLVSIRLLQDVGIPSALETAMRFGFSREQLPATLSLALGSGHAPPLKMAAAYAVFANGGFLVNPYLIERIEDHSGAILFRANPKAVCRECALDSQNGANAAPRVISPQINFLMTSLLRDVVERGTATQAKQLGRGDLAGKTGTTNDQRDAWFNGFTPDVSASAWIGFDNSQSLGKGETGGKAALPMWIDFMQTALRDIPEAPLSVPEGIVQAYINPADGLLLDPSNKNGQWEFFIADTAPQRYSQPKQQDEYEIDEEWLKESLF